MMLMMSAASIHDPIPGPRCAQIGDLGGASGIQHNVARLHIQVNDRRGAAVQVVEPPHNLPRPGSRECLWQRADILDEALQTAAGAILEDEINDKSVVLLSVPSAVETTTIKLFLLLLLLLLNHEWIEPLRLELLHVVGLPSSAARNPRTDELRNIRVVRYSSTNLNLGKKLVHGF